MLTDFLQYLGELGRWLSLLSCKMWLLCHTVTSYCCYILSFSVDIIVTACFTGSFS